MKKIIITENILNKIINIISENNINNQTVNYQYPGTTWRLSNDGFEFIKSFEKYRSLPYKATGNEKYYTIGYGHVMINNEYANWIKNGKKPMSQQEAINLLWKDLTAHANDFRKALSNLPEKYQNPKLYPQGFVDACISIVFNSGIGNFKGSSFYQKWIDWANKGSIRIKKDKNIHFDFNDYCTLISSIKNACATNKSQKSIGLENRRLSEYVMAKYNKYEKHTVN